MPLGFFWPTFTEWDQTTSKRTLNLSKDEAPLKNIIKEQQTDKWISKLAPRGREHNIVIMYIIHINLYPEWLISKTFGSKHKDLFLHFNAP